MENSFLKSFREGFRRLLGWDNLDKRVTLGSLTAVATAEDAKAMTSASFNGTGVLVLRGDANGDVFKNFTDKDGKALDIALNVNTFFGDEDGDAGVINNSLTASKQVTNNGDFTVNGKLTLSGTDTAGLNGGFHKFGKPVFPLRRQYPKQRREPQHRSDVEAFL